MKIAVIEDDKPIAKMYKHKLDLVGFETFIAYNGKDGLKIIQENQPDLALVDLRMPEMTGDEMIERIRSDEKGKNLRIIVLTNISKSEAPKSLQFLGIDRYAVKAHHTPKQVANMVDEVLGIKRDRKLSTRA